MLGKGCSGSSSHTKIPKGKILVFSIFSNLRCP
ncbi:hypothetical protein SETIT_1G143500v2 [Setaria italica]|uniref:Uncharacterized protein n=2 Tax=Setaria TaxID=4554 RepID=A0A368PKL2_SETIT|nr:hypothetical protein SETIT_1G143500v2 [Setaria italica]TKW38853.1 hypothetical protein SEVIR_1G142300v2 [Setaria viridis]